MKQKSCSLTGSILYIKIFLLLSSVFIVSRDKLIMLGNIF